MKHIEQAALTRLELADDAQIMPSGLKIGAGQLKLADKMAISLGFAVGMKHHLAVGMIAYILAHPDYQKSTGFSLLEFRAALKKVNISLDKVLTTIQDQSVSF